MVQDKYITKKGEFQEEMKKLFSDISTFIMCVLLVIGSATDWAMPVRIALGVLAAAMLVDVIITIGGMISGKHGKKKD